MSMPEKYPYAACMDTCELLCSGQFAGINSKNARGIPEHRMKQKEERNNVMKKQTRQSFCAERVPTKKNII